MIFLTLLMFEMGVGLTSFEYNEYTALFIVFGMGKFIWRILTIFFVVRFIQDLQAGIPSSDPATDAALPSSNTTRSPSLVPVFKLIVTNPDNRDLDITNNEAEERFISRLSSA
jgi:hypothetical protein